MIHLMLPPVRPGCEQARNLESGPQGARASNARIGQRQRRPSVYVSIHY